VLVAKQAAEVDLLSEGRFRLGVGIGWNHVEYESLGEDFRTRGRRIEEQVALLRRLWTEESVTFRGEFDTVTAAGIAPMPIQRPIPVWFGGSSPRAYERIGRLADGWFPQMLTDADYDGAWSQVAASARAAGRDPGQLGIHARHWVGAPEDLTARIETWRARHATHVAIDTMRVGLGSVDAHLEALADVAKALELSAVA
jgi:probable F420-dependent oxidoreductase